MGFKLEGATLVIDLGDGPLHVWHGTVIDPQVTEQDIAGPIDNQGTMGWMDDQHGVSSVNRDMRCFIQHQAAIGLAVRSNVQSLLRLEDNRA